MSSIEQKIEQLREKAALLEAAKKTDAEDSLEDLPQDEEDDEIVNTDETKPKKDEKKIEESKIDLGNLFTGTELTEEFKEKATLVFEAAVEARVKQEVANLEEELAQKFVNESIETKLGLVEQVDGYLGYMVEQWMKNNEVALERGVKAEIFESFVSKMHSVFVEHNIVLPDEEFDLVESLQMKNEELGAKLDESTAQIVEMNKAMKEVSKNMKIEEATKGMTDLDAEKFALLAEELSFEDEKTFAEKLNAIRENYVSAPAAKQTQLTEDVTYNSNTPVIMNEEVTIDPTMAQYLTGLR
jgi:hypothetical protein